MHSLELIREDPERFDRDLVRRGLDPASTSVLALDLRRRKLVSALQEMQAERNKVSKEVGTRKGRGEDAGDLLERMGALKKEIPGLEEQVREADVEIHGKLAELPNRLSPDVPPGEDESANKEFRRWGEPPKLGFEPQDHVALGEGLGLMDFESSARMSGARFVTLLGPLAQLERALGNFMIDLQTGEHGYREVSPPSLVRKQALFGTGQLPKFTEDLFRTTDGRWLVPTAEVPLTNLVAEKVLEEGVLPLRVTAWTPCFRAEAGAAGQDSRGMIRVHQFSKVELVSVTHPDESEAELERMTGCAEEVLKRLEIPYRIVMLSAGDTGFSAHKTYDIEVWLPGQGAYREISSCSNCGAFQARRMNARFRPKEGKLNHVHTLNGSGLAVGRLLVAILENGQEADGSIRIPEPVRPYFGGTDRLEP